MRLDEKIAALSAQDLFRALEPQALHVLAFSATVRRLKAGEELFRQGEAADGGFVVAAGRVSVSAEAVAGGDDDALGRGGLIGMAALVTETTRPQNVFALEPTVVLVLPRVLMKRVLEDHPTSATMLRQQIVERLRSTESRLKALA